jgi:two-component system sensor histidine kinase TctE
VFYVVRRADGQFISGDPEFPAPPNYVVADAGPVRLRDDQIRGEDVRVAYTWIARGEHEEQLVLLQVAETLGKRSRLATEIIKGVMVPQFVTLPLAVLLVWMALVRGIRPLNELEQRIRARQPDDLSPLEQESIPQEVTPLVASINDLLERLKVSLTTQRRFLADAAHQLKTPLAGLRMQADLALRAQDPDEVRRCLQQITRSSVRATHTVSQLLSLARAETTGRALPSEPVDLGELATEVIVDSYPLAQDKRIDLGYEGPDRIPEFCLLQGNPTLLQELVRNLVDNAIHYTPAGGVVTVRLTLDGDGAQQLEVEDDGPGIPEAERELVLQPFYRVLGSNVDGSGLGLSIVSEVAQQYRAQVELSDAHPGQQARRGLRVTVRFPARLPA